MCVCQGETQVVTVNFKRLVHAHEVRITFQGGFVGQVRPTWCIGAACVSRDASPLPLPQDCAVEATAAKKADFAPVCELHPKDINETQVWAHVVA